MQLEIRGRISRPDALDYAKKTVRRALDAFAHAIPHVQIRLGQQDGDAVCRLICEVRIPHTGGAPRTLVIEAASDSFMEAIEHAALRAAERVMRELGDRRERPSGAYLMEAHAFTTRTPTPWQMDSDHEDASVPLSKLG
jgi:hypothetical protein